MQLLLLARHGQSVLNVRGVVNGDPDRDLGLSPLGLQEGAKLGQQLAGLAVELAVTSEFPRARQTAELALGGRDVPHLVDAGLNDIRIGDLEGLSLADYRAWKHAHGRHEPMPGGESLDDAAQRYAAAFERLLERADGAVLCVCHEVPVRYLVNAAGGSGELDAPIHDVANATPYVFDADGLRRGVDRLRLLAG